MESPQKISLGIPKGSLQEQTFRFFKEAGFDIAIPDERSYYLEIDDPQLECFLLRPQEIPQYIEQGKLDLGISGRDWILEQEADVVEVCDLRYAKKEIQKVKWVLAVHKDSNIRSVKDLAGKTVSTEIVNLARAYFKKQGVPVKVEFSWGATEAKPPRFVDAIVDLMETGNSLEANDLKVLDTVLESSTVLIANEAAWQNDWKKEKIEALAMLLQGRIKNQRVTGLMLHVPGKILGEILTLLKKFDEPGVKKIADIDFYDVSLRCGFKDARDLIPQLKKAGCGDIVEYPVVKVLP